MNRRIAIPREVLLVEIERRCRDPLCNARVRIGLTREEARSYRGFDCPRCEQTWDDRLAERDVPEWWAELNITRLDGTREIDSDAPMEESEVVSRLSDDFRHTRDKITAGEDSSLSEISPRVAPQGRAREPQAEPFLLPQWVINGIRASLYALSRLFFRVRLKGTENIPPSGGFILASNHQSYFDPIWNSLPIWRRMHYLAWSESFSWPIIGKVILMLGAWPIKLEKGDPTAIRRALQWLRNGNPVVIYPEGGRCLPDGKLLRFKPGAVRMALEANIPILPVTIRGGHRVWPKGYRFPHIGKVELVYHPLQYVAVREGEDSRQCARRETERLAETIGSALEDKV